VSYKDDILSTQPKHLFPLDGDGTDIVNSLGSDDEDVIWDHPPITKDATYSMTVESVGAALDLDGSDYIQAVDQVFVAGWFKTEIWDQPITNIVGDGAAANALSIHMGFGNNVIYEVYSSWDGREFCNQIFGDTPIYPGRVYHFALQHENDDYGNYTKGWLDGVPQLLSNDNIPNGSQRPDVKAPATIGGKDNSVGGLGIHIVSPIGSWNYWGWWQGDTASSITTETIRKEFFEKGVLPEYTISSQSDLDNLAGTEIPNCPCGIEIVSDSDLDLSADGIVFDNLCSLHILWSGPGKLTWTNTNGSNASISGAPWGGEVEIINYHNVKFINLKDNTEIRIFNAGTTEEVAGVENASDTWETSVKTGTYDIRVVSLNYRIIEFKNVNIEEDQEFKLEQFYDRNYKND